jgi:hypothetical protein
MSDKEIMFPEWVDTLLADDENINLDDRVAYAIHRNNEMNPVLKVYKSTIKGMSPDRPWGTFAHRGLDSRIVVVEYTGVVGASHSGGRYVFENDNGTFTDGENPLLSGVARFINSTGPGESEDANVEVCCRDGKLFVDSIKYIHKGQELLYDYGTKYNWHKGEQASGYTRLVARRKPKCMACAPTANHNHTRCHSIRTSFAVETNKLLNNGSIEIATESKW